MKKILFVIDSLHCAGAEKSLITLLSLLDYSKYEVDLQLLGYGGALEKLLPKEVNLLKPLKYTDYCNMGIKSAIGYSAKTFKWNMLISRVKFTLELRKGKYTNAQKARIYWQKSAKAIENNNKEYDVAISYAQGVPTFYVADKIKAKKKYAWVNVSYRLNEEDKMFQKKYYDIYDNIIAVSDSAKEVFLGTFPEYSEKSKIIYDINDGDFIKRMAEEGSSYEDNYKGLRILTVGRLSHQKGYDIALEACKILRDKGIEFRWYSLGIGPLKDEIEQYIKDNNLEENFKLLGVKANPYPYIKECDIYVQTSKFEGFGLAIAEARMLNRPVVTTRFDAVYNQMIDRKNGLVVDMNSKGIANGILELINDKELTSEIIKYLETEKKGNIEELERFYELVGEE